MRPIIEAVVAILTPAKVRLDDFVDRLCYRYTPMLLGLLLCITGTIDYLGKPLSCMLPAEYNEYWANYVHQYCFVTGTYLKQNSFVGAEGNKMDKVYVHYYQWVPFVIIIQALAYRLPHHFWRFGQSMTDVDFNHVNELGCEARMATGQKREEKLNEAVDYIYMINYRDGSGLGSWASYTYLLYKMINLVVTIAQIIFLNKFVGYNDSAWGITLAKWSWNNFGWQDKFSYFPRIAYCQFGRDFLGNGDGEVLSEVRCVLSVNMLNEKVFMFLFFWYYFLAFLTTCNTLFYFVRLLPPYHIISVHSLIGMTTTSNVKWSVSRKMANDVLGQDGVLLLRFVRQNSGALVASEIGSRLYAKIPKSQGN